MFDSLEEIQKWWYWSFSWTGVHHHSNNFCLAVSKNWFWLSPGTIWIDWSNIEVTSH